MEEEKHLKREELMETLDEYFNRGVDRKKFIDVNRIPLICQDIKGIHERLEKIDANIAWVVKIVLGAVIVALLGLVIKG